MPLKVLPDNNYEVFPILNPYFPHLLNLQEKSRNSLSHNIKNLSLENPLDISMNSYIQE